MRKLHDDLLQVYRQLPDDYEPFGKVERTGGDCSCGCKFFQPLKNAEADWGVCTNIKSHRCNLLTFEHQGCLHFESGKEKTDKQQQWEIKHGYLYFTINKPIIKMGTKDQLLSAIKDKKLAPKPNVAQTEAFLAKYPITQNLNGPYQKAVLPYAIAKYFHVYVCNTNDIAKYPDIRNAKVNDCIDAARKLLNDVGGDWEIILQVIEFVFNIDDFWKFNMRAMSKFRENWPKILGQYEQYNSRKQEKAHPSFRVQ